MSEDSGLEQQSQSRKQPATQSCRLLESETASSLPMIQLKRKSREESRYPIRRAPGLIEVHTNPVWEKVAC